MFANTLSTRNLVEIKHFLGTSLCSKSDLDVAFRRSFFSSISSILFFTMKENLENNRNINAIMVFVNSDFVGILIYQHPLVFQNAVAE